MPLVLFLVSAYSASMNSNLSLTDDLWQSTLRFFQKLVFHLQFPSFPLSLRKRARSLRVRFFFALFHAVDTNPISESTFVHASSFATLQSTHVSITIFTASSLNSVRSSSSVEQKLHLSRLSILIDILSVRLEHFNAFVSSAAVASGALRRSEIRPKPSDSLR